MDGGHPALGGIVGGTSDAALVLAAAAKTNTQPACAEAAMKWVAYCWLAYIAVAFIARPLFHRAMIPTSVRQSETYRVQADATGNPVTFGLIMLVTSGALAAYFIDDVWYPGPAGRPAGWALGAACAAVEYRAVAQVARLIRPSPSSADWS
jgi:hypothetical protein